ncbi:MAG: MBL fold metallo-hydrolase [Deltaproteobacteria bacterium]|nr:MBL fold metallo-hydrolase [Deltaproteobacteria bacterium]
MMLKEVDRVEVLTLMDNYVDVLLGDTKTVRRAAHSGGGEIFSDTVIGEHGLSLLVTVYEGAKMHTILFDTGYSAVGVPHNIKHLGVDLTKVEAIVLSHGHMDHLGSLNVLLEKMPKPMPVLVHPYAFTSPRYVTRKDGGKDRFPVMLDRGEIEKRGGRIKETAEPTLICDDMIMVSGEVERTTSFEKGMPHALVEKNGKLEKDPILDDQALFARLKGEGLVVIGGCSHAGIVNTVVYGKKITGAQTVHAVLGGFHLAGPFFEPIIGDTLDALKAMDPKVVVPMHCTGWKAIHRFEEAFPGVFILNAVGSKYTFSSVSAA